MLGAVHKTCRRDVRRRSRYVSSQHSQHERSKHQHKRSKQQQYPGRRQQGARVAREAEKQGGREAGHLQSIESQLFPEDLHRDIGVDDATGHPTEQCSRYSAANRERATNGMHRFHVNHPAQPLLNSYPNTVFSSTTKRSQVRLNTKQREMTLWASEYCENCIVCWRRAVARSKRC